MIAKYLNQYKPNGILHIGAHKGQEVEIYTNAGFFNVVWVEAIPEIYKVLLENISVFGHKAINALLADVEGKEIKFKISSNQDGVSSSIFSWGEKMNKKYPFVKEKKVIRLKTQTLENLYKKHNLQKLNLDFLVLDVQGAELLVLKGAGKILDEFKYIYVEVSREELYEGGVLFEDLDKFLNSHGYIIINPNGDFHCNEFYIKKS